MVNNDVRRGFQSLQNKAPINSQFPIYDSWADVIDRNVIALSNNS